jgi:hypothetical protein
MNPTLLRDDVQEGCMSSGPIKNAQLTKKYYLGSPEGLLHYQTLFYIHPAKAYLVSLW